MTLITSAVLLLASPLFAENAGLQVYPAVPGLPPSEQYSFKVRTVGSTNWLDSFAFITRCQQGGSTNHYFEHLEDWSQTYINFEMSNAVPVEIEISKVGGAPITNAVVHPQRKASSCEVIGGKAYVVIDDPALFTVDIDGQMDDQDTGKGYVGPPIHTLTVFANPFLQNKPSINDPNVFLVQPGVVPADTGPWDTLYFLPGVHDIGLDFHVHANKNYYIPGDAIVHGTLNNQKVWNDGHDILIFGHGTLSGERYPHPDDDSPPAPDEDDWKYKPIDIVGAKNTTVEGITITDSAMHSLMLINGYAPETPTDIRWTKIVTWRGNGDGINPFGNGLIEDCFIRTQDDSTYVNGRGIRRVVYWNDANGSAFVLSPVGGISNPNLVVEDCDVVYARASWNNWSGGRLFNMRGEGSGTGGSNVVFRNIRVEDPRPTLQHFMIAMQGVEPWSDPEERQRGPGDLDGVLFQNIEIVAPSVLGEPDVLWGSSNAWIRNLTFDNVTIGGQPLVSADHFQSNEYVTNLHFVNAVAMEPYFWNHSGDGLWRTATNWAGSAGTNAIPVPRSTDAVKHTVIGGNLLVDSTAYAFDLDVSNNSTATVTVASGGHLMVDNRIDVGNADSAGIGMLVVNGGAVDAGNTLTFGRFGSRLGLGELNSGSITVEGVSSLGGNNATASGELTISGGTFSNTNDLFNVGLTGDGTLNMNGGVLHLHIDDGIWNPLRIGKGAGNGIVNLTDGTIMTRGIQMDWGDTDPGASTINLFGGTLQVEGGFASAVRMGDTAQMNFGEGRFLWKGNRVADFASLVSGGFIAWANGQDGMLTENWEESWTNGTSILFADYNDVSNGYTTVWATKTSAYASWSNQYGLVEGSDGDDDQDLLSNLYEYGLGGDPTNPLHQGHLPTFGNEGVDFDYIHAVRSDPNSGLDYYLELNENLLSNGWIRGGYSVIGTNVVAGDFDLSPTALPPSEQPTSS